MNHAIIYHEYNESNTVHKPTIVYIHFRILEKISCYLHQETLWETAFWHKFILCSPAKYHIAPAHRSCQQHCCSGHPMESQVARGSP